MTVLTVASSKGGPGKTTLCQVLAGSLAGKIRVVVLDADPTQAVSRWAANAYEGPPMEVLAEADEARLAHLIAAKAENADLVLVDTAGFGNRAATVAMRLNRRPITPRCLPLVSPWAWDWPHILMRILTDADGTALFKTALSKAIFRPGGQSRPAPSVSLINRLSRFGSDDGAT